jgi:flagellar motor switch/type III secretory pathway protein FliN
MANTDLDLVDRDLMPQAITLAHPTGMNTEFTPVVPATIDPIEAEVNNHLLSQATLFKHRMAQTEITWRWICVSDQLPQPAAHKHLRLASGNEEISIHIVRSDPGFLDDQVDPNMFEGSAQILAYALRYSPFMNLLEKLTGRTWNLLEATDCTASTETSTFGVPFQTFGFEVKHENAVTSMSGRLTFKSDCSAYWIATQGARVIRTGAYSELPFRFLVVIRRNDFTFNEVQDFSVGTVIIAQSGPADQRNVQILTPDDRYQMGGIFKDNLISLLEPWKPSRSAFTSEKIPAMETFDTQEPSNQSLSIKASDLPVEITFCLGHVTAPFRELESNYHAGFVITLDEKLHEETVSVKANGVDIAKGELLQVGELLAVRLTRMMKHGSR